MAIPIETKGYSEYTVAFLDVLGLTEAIKESVGDAGSCEKIAGLLGQLQETVITRAQQFQDSTTLPDIAISSFSDSIIISSPTISEDSIKYILWIVSEFCVKAIVGHGFFVRGALTIGPHWEYEGVSFGPAMIRAIQMEQSVALWPRCIIDPVVFTRRDTCPSKYWRKRYWYLLVGSDGLPYLDYLRYAFITYLWRMAIESVSSKSNSHESTDDKLVLKVVEWHKRAICQAIDDTRQSRARTTLLHTKYYPLALYHNTVVRGLSRGLPKSSDYNEIAPRSWAGRFFSDLESFASREGIDTRVIEREKRDLLVRLVKAREQWRRELIDLDSLLTGYGEPTLSEPEV